MINLPTYQNSLKPYKLSGKSILPRPTEVDFTRTAFAASHVVSNPLDERDPWNGRPSIDWDNTLQFRHFLWTQGLGLAEAMDTAQRGMGLDWPTAKELIERTMREAKAHPQNPRVACGAGTDQYPVDELTDLNKITAAYTEQMETVETAGGQVIIMASRAMAKYSRGPDNYISVYSKLISQAVKPVVLHWLGDMFDPALKGYWGHVNVNEASETVLDIINSHPEKIDGIKISLLDQGMEERFRAQLPEGIKLYTGDDFNYPQLIAGDGKNFSDALLGIFAAISPVAAQALEALAQGNLTRYHELFSPTVPLSREIFKAPTQYYKAGIAFLAWLNGIQSHFVMPFGLQSSREIAHYAEIFRLGDISGLLANPDLATHRMQALLKLHGVD
ncbi:MAG: dihydrodipicolinate synthase family protein [Rhodobacteraceae bacterium]|nr:dihydrodipicolinate synthase family protein [Paracoccaceae bacterium]